MCICYIDCYEAGLCCYLVTNRKPITSISAVLFLFVTHLLTVPRIYIYIYIYCDISTHCWVTQPVSKHHPVNKISARTRWRHATALEYGSYATCRDDVTRNRSRGLSRDIRVSASDAIQLSPCSLPRYESQTPLPGNSNARTIDGYIRGTGMSKQSVVK
jgi:hypothetical protein